MGGAQQQQHFVLVPWISIGHVIPMMEVARLLARRGVLVTVIITPVSAARIRDVVIEPVKAAGLSIRFVELPFPAAEAGLPDGIETIEQIVDPTFFPKIHVAADLLRRPLLAYLREMEQPAPSCILGDLYQPMAREVARELRVPLLIYYVFPCFTILCYRSIRRNKIYETVTDCTVPFLVPDSPQRLEVTRAEAPGTFDRPGWEWCRDEAMAAESAAAGAVFHSFDDLEPWFLKRFEEMMGMKAWAIGPLALMNKDVASKASRGFSSAVDVGGCLSWLDSMKPGSVVYACFGSNTYYLPSHIIEIGAGLEASGHPFIWVIKEREWTPEVDEWISSGFKERVGSRAIVIRGWAPQSSILFHAAIGGFMTHCGWNSCIEGVAAGVPMITWPHFEDQFLQGKMIVEVLKIGIGLAGVKAGEDYVEQVMNTAVKRGDVERAVRDLLGGGEKAEGRRIRARELKEKARKAMEEGGSSSVNLTQLLDSIAHRGD